MQCIYINLDAQTERREFVEQNFAEHNSHGWPLLRQSAVDREIVATLGSEGIISPVEKACFLSHMMAINTSLPANDHVLIMEDDVLFGPLSMSYAASSLITAPADWDVIFLDVGVLKHDTMVTLQNERARLVKDGKLTLVKLETFEWIGATAYIVNEHSRSKLVEMLADFARNGMNATYDLLLYHWCKLGFLNGYVVFPFATSLSAHADVSQIQPDAQERVDRDRQINVFRRAMWAHRDLASVEREIEQISQPYFTDREPEIVSRIIGKHQLLKEFNKA